MYEEWTEQQLRDRLLKMNEKQILVEIAMMLYKEK